MPASMLRRPGRGVNRNAAGFSVSGRLQSEDELAPIQNLDSYLFHSFVRRSSKRARASVPATTLLPLLC